MKLNVILAAIYVVSLFACHSNEMPQSIVVKDSIIVIRDNMVVKEIPKRGRIFKPLKINAPIKRLLVKKGAQMLIAYFGDTFKEYRVAVGANPIGHKQQKGDNRTPEGSYTIVLKNPKSRGYKSLKISYPNNQDRSSAWQRGCDPGGDICIHGLWWDSQDPLTHWQSNWTQGCVALNNQQMDELYKYTAVSTPITIVP